MVCREFYIPAEQSVPLNQRESIVRLRSVSIEEIRSLLAHRKPYANNGGLRPLTFSESILEEIAVTANASNSRSMWTIRPIVATLGALLEKKNDRIRTRKIAWRIGYEQSGVIRAVKSLERDAAASWDFSVDEKRYRWAGLSEKKEAK